MLETNYGELALASPPPAEPQAPPPPPGPDASRDEWHAWRRRQREFERAQWSRGGWYGPWWGGGWPWFWGAALIFLGAYYLLSNLGLLGWLRGDVVWPVLLILFGIFLIARRRSPWW